MVALGMVTSVSMVAASSGLLTGIQFAHGRQICSLSAVHYLSLDARVITLVPRTSTSLSVKVVSIIVEAVCWLMSDIATDQDCVGREAGQVSGIAS
jgi:hypothetical protein